MKKFWTTIASLALSAAVLLAGCEHVRADGLGYSRKIAADDPASPTFNWTGFYLGLGAGYRMVDTNTEIGTAPAFESVWSIDGLGGQGWLPDLKGGLDYRFSGTPIVIGVFGTWTPDGWGDASFSTNYGWSTSGTLSPTYALGGRLGLVMANSNLLYVGYKRQWADLSITRGDETVNKSIAGNGVIGGIEMPLTARGAPLQMTFSVEGFYDRYDTMEFKFDKPLDARVQPDDLGVMARLNIRTGFFGN